MDIRELNIRLEEFQSLDLDSILTSDKPYNMRELEKAFLAIKNSNSALVLSTICGILLNPSITQHPFSARFESETRRSVIPSDFSPETFSSLSKFCPEISNPMLKARISDILWVTRNGKINFAIMAVESYLKAAKDLITIDEEYNKNDVLKLLERALRLSCSLKNHPQIGILYTEIIKFSKYEITNNNVDIFYVLKLIELMLELAPPENNISSLKITLEKIADESVNNKQYFVSQRAYESLLILAYKDEDKEREFDIYRKIADCYMLEATLRNSGFVSASFINRAIDTLAKIPDTRQERIELYELMRDYQREGLTSLQVISSEEKDITQIKNTAIAKVQGKDLFDTLMRFGLLITQPTNIELLQNDVKSIEKNNLLNIFSSVHYDHDGMQVAHVQSSDDLILGSEDKNWESLIRLLKVRHQISTEGQIYPALDKIVTEYHFNEEVFYDLFKNHPFIPDGHENFYVKGIFSGFKGDFLTASHLLIPQIENSLRFILKITGEEPTRLHGDGSQERESLASLLDNEDVHKILTKTITDNLKTILLDKIYGDQRNQLSHGYVPSNYFFQSSAIYLWWLIFHILMVPFYNRWKEKYNPVF